MTSSQFNKAFKQKYHETFPNRRIIPITLISTMMGYESRTKHADHTVANLLVNALEGLDSQRVGIDDVLTQFLIKLEDREEFAGYLSELATAFEVHSLIDSTAKTPREWILEIIADGNLEYTGK